MKRCANCRDEQRLRSTSNVSSRCLVKNELGADHIRVNSILPGWTYTQRVEQLIAGRMAKSRKTLEAEIAEVCATIPLGRMGTPEEFANVAVFLCSPAASYVNGVMLQVDGGLTQGIL